MRSQLERIAGPILRRVPLGWWPPAVSRAAGILTPRAMVPHSTPRATGGANINMLLEFLKKTRELPGDVAECGVWRGRTLIAMGLHLKQSHSEKTLWGFDSFKGFDQDVPHDFRDASFDLVKHKAEIFGLSNVKIVPGYFRDSLPSVNDRTFSFVHIDCDIYESYKECLEFFYPRITSGGIMLFDEYDDPDWPGANQAVNEFCARHSVRLQSSVKDNFKKTFIEK